MGRTSGITAGIFAHALFAITVPRLFLFLQDTHYRSAEGLLWIDVCLTLQFVLPHSLLLFPSVRSRLTQIIPGEFYGLFYTVVTCGSLWLVFVYWRQSPVVLWQLTGLPKTLATAGFLGSWPALLYSLSLTGFGWQTGWTPWVHWVQHASPPRRVFQPRGAYRVLRHPVYLSFLGLIWFSPTMTLDRAVLTAVWTAYIFYGSYLKDERLAYYLGDIYRRYQATVSGYPGVIWGPLGKRSRKPLPLRRQERGENR